MPKKTPHRFHPCPKRNGIGSERNKRINAEDFLDYRLRSGDLDYSRRRDVDRFQPSRRRKSMQIASLLFCFLSIVSLVRSVLRSKLIRICSAAVGRRRGVRGWVIRAYPEPQKGGRATPRFHCFYAAVSSRPPTSLHYRSLRSEFIVRQKRG